MNILRNHDLTTAFPFSIVSNSYSKEEQCNRIRSLNIAHGEQSTYQIGNGLAALSIAYLIGAVLTYVTAIRHFQSQWG